MAREKCLLTVWNRLVEVLHGATRDNTAPLLPLSSPTSKTSVQSRWEILRGEIDSLGEYDLHDILSHRITVGWCEWHLTIDENDNAIEIAKQFQQDFEKVKSSSSIVGKIDTITETFLNFMPMDNYWNKVRQCFKQARQEDSPLPIVKACTLTQEFSKRLNMHSAANTYHELKLYCTVLNCPILAQTREYTEAITSILFHPKLDQFLVRQTTVYRGIILKDKKLISSYKQGATIITTATFLSTSTNPEIADSFGTSPDGDQISILCIYNISNTHRRTALNLGPIGNFADEDEILILRYVPFTIKLLEVTDDGRKMKICFDECPE